MIFSVIYGLLLFWIIWSVTKSTRNTEAYKKRYGSHTATRIKYDKRQVRQYAIGAAIAGGFLAVSLVLICTNIYWISGRFSAVLMLITLYGLFLGGMLLIIFGYLVISGLAYFKRLEKYGYSVPEDKRAYECVLEQMPENKGRMPGQIFQGPDVPQASKTSKVLMGLSILVCLAMVGASFYYLYKWSFMGDDTMVLFVLLLIMDVLWLVPVLIFRNQMNVQKYKDDVEIDANRKNRMNMCSGIAVIVVLVGVSLGAKWLAYDMSEYVFKSQMIEDQKKISEIRDVMEIAYMDPYVSESDDWLEETRYSLEAGVDITNWDEPEGEFQESVARMLEITDFSELKDAFYIADGPAIVHVKLEGKDFTVQLMNVYPAADREIIAGPLGK